MSNQQSSSVNRWYPSRDQLKDVDATHRAFRQLLDQHYALVDRLNAMEQTGKSIAGTPAAGPPPGSGPTDTQLLGLRVAPVDTNTLANGAVLTFDKASGNFKFI